MAADNVTSVGASTPTDTQRITALEETVKQIKAELELLRRVTGHVRPRQVQPK